MPSFVWPAGCPWVWVTLAKHLTQAAHADKEVYSAHGSGASRSEPPSTGSVTRAASAPSPGQVATAAAGAEGWDSTCSQEQGGLGGRPLALLDLSPGGQDSLEGSVPKDLPLSPFLSVLVSVGLEELL